MTQEPLTITLEPDSDLARALADADVAVILESDGVRYTVSPENVFARYDPQAALRGLRQSRGALEGVNGEELLTDLDEMRSQDPSRRPVQAVAYLLDSNLVIPSLTDDPATVPLVERLAFDGIAISIITCKYMEVYQGTLRSPDPERAQDQLASFLAGVPTLPFSPAVARRCASLREELKDRGRRVPDLALDVMIAATALEYGLQLVTRNLADYEDIPHLTVYRQNQHLLALLIGVIDLRYQERNAQLLESGRGVAPGRRAVVSQNPFTLPERN